MSHPMAPLPTTTTQHAAIALVPMVSPKPLALKNSGGGVLPPGAKRDTRRVFLHGLMIAAGAGTLLRPDIALAASKRRPPPPAEEEKEKKDPNVSGVQAKVLASRKRKEAMKESVAKMREKGKPVSN